jgi:hypothetical protein
MASIIGLLPTLIHAIDIASTAIPAGTEAYEKLQAHRAKIQSFIDEGRDPTPEEFQALQAETDALTDRLRAADNRLNPSG